MKETIKQAREELKRQAHEKRIQEMKKEAIERVELAKRLEAEEAIMDREKELNIRAFRLPRDRVALRKMIHNKRNCQRRMEEKRAEQKYIQVMEMEKEATERVELANRMEAEAVIMGKEKELSVRAFRLPPDRVALRRMIHNERRRAELARRARSLEQLSAMQMPPTPTFTAERSDSLQEPSGASSPPHTPRRASIMKIGFMLN
ncbi:hypothetical protein MMC07_000702 [Pseudocyphellaria aurata]|nr:hypothetical protein [Pseudocyphellaria aurata]